MADLVVNQVKTGAQTIAAAAGTSIALTVWGGDDVVVANCYYWLTVLSADSANRAKRHVFTASISTTQMTLVRNQGTDATSIDIEYGVVEFTSGMSSEASTEAVEVSNNPNSVTISAAPSTRTIVMVEGVQVAGNQTSNGYVSARADDTHFSYVCSPALEDKIISYQVLLFDTGALDGLGFFVFTDAYTSPTADPSVSVTANSLVMGGAGETGSNSASRHNNAFQLNSTTEVEMHPYGGAGTKTTPDGSCWVMEHSSIAAERGAVAVGDAETTPGTAPTITTGYTVVPQAALDNNVYMSNSADSPGTPDQNQFTMATSGTSMIVTRDTAADDYTAVWQATDWTLLVAAGGGTNLVAGSLSMMGVGI